MKKILFALLALFALTPVAEARDGPLVRLRERIAARRAAPAAVRAPAPLRIYPTYHQPVPVRTLAPVGCPGGVCPLPRR